MGTPGLTDVIGDLAAAYGEPAAPRVTGPWEMIVWENVAYLVDEARRETAFRRLESAVGLTPEAILAAPDDELLRAIRPGSARPEERVERLRRAAELAVAEFDGDLSNAVRRPLPGARKALGRFPGIGEPGAERILLFSGHHPVLALDSNALRVLLRLGFGRESSSYAASYRSARQAAAAQLPIDCVALLRSTLLLQQHGRETCRRSAPQCSGCPCRDYCPSRTGPRA